MVQQHAVATQAADADQAVISQLCPGNGGAVRQWVVTPAGEYKVLLHQRDKLDVRVLAAHHVDAEVGLAAQHGFEPVVGAKVQQANADFRVLLVVIADHRRQEVERRGRDAGEGNLTGLAFGQLADAEDRVFKIIQQAPGLGQEVAAHAGQADPASGAFQ
ncbi:hypothetical protein D3C76_1187360 [compost metagenome]